MSLLSISALMSGFRVIFAVARVSFLEILRDRVLAQLMVLTLLVFLASIVTAQVSPAVTSRVMVDFTWGALLLSCSIIAVFQGGTVISRELERRTLFVALGRPIYRMQWYLGKFFGVCSVLLLNWGVFVLVTQVLFYLVGIDTSNLPPWITQLAVSSLILLQSWVLAALALFFSTFSSASMSIAVSFGIYLIGSSHTQFRWLATQVEGSTRLVLRVLENLTPNFELFHLSRILTYAIPLEFETWLSRTCYGLIWCLILLLVGGSVFKRREF